MQWRRYTLHKVPRHSNSLRFRHTNLSGRLMAREEFDTLKAKDLMLDTAKLQ